MSELMPKYGENRAITGGQYDKFLAVKCINGTFVGQRKENVLSFKGIPYVGQQPVGPLRWKAPAAFTPDSGVYEAYHYGKSPVQSPGDPASLYPMGEDCLTLNLWKADDAATGKPVVVWIYGGAFEVGGTTDPQYDCHNLVQEFPDVIFVTVNYRVSFLGFFHLAHLADGKDYQDAPNLGLMDQMMALRWVRENIAAFGGDPENVTIWGESAGGASCALLPLVKGSHQYFHRAIIQSGSPSQTRSPEQAIVCTDKVLEALGCKTVADLMQVSAEKLAEVWTGLYGFFQKLGIRTFPERDGVYLPLDTWKAYEDGAAKDIEFLQGCNKDEMNTFLGVVGKDVWNAWADARLEEKLAQLTDKEKDLVKSYCADIPGERCEATVRIAGQIMFIAPQIRLSEAQAKAGGKSYTYYYTVESAVPMIKSGHASELSVVFNHPEFTDFTGRAIDETFCKAMRRMWIQFARTGRPSPEWPLYDSKDKQVMVLDEFDIHPAKESELKIVDWDRTLFLTRYYML
ncbi:MAG: carboxylesterase/lipase family protein [Bacteroidales bacterium]|nr:carboxylesterase/lipase family protein [Bacteroidales bacterium]